MKIMIAQHSGYCYGVKRAVQTLDHVLEHKKASEDVFTLGPIIHNEQVTQHYAGKGVQIISELDSLSLNNPKEVKLIIRSHGAPKSVYDQAAQMGIEILDATCPYVKKIQNKVSTYAAKGYNIIIVGNSNHPEVIGINGWCENKAIIISTVDEAKRLMDKSLKVCVVCQTTFNVEKWRTLETLFKTEFEHVVICNTICLATEQRQSACLELAQKVELMIVVGGKHSSNTIKLAEICGEVVETKHIETKDDLDGSEWNGKHLIGIAAGASTPDWIIQSVVLKIENEGEVFF